MHTCYSKRGKGGKKGSTQAYNLTTKMIVLPKNIYTTNPHIETQLTHAPLTISLQSTYRKTTDTHTSTHTTTNIHSDSQYTER